MTVSTFVELRGITIEEIGVAPVSILCWGRKLTGALAELMGASPCENWLYPERSPLYSGEVEGHPVSICHVPVGAPGTIMIMEEMIACGANALLGFGTCGSLRPEAPIGTCIIPNNCLSEEGTSSHYIEPGTELAPDPRLVEALRESCEREGLSPLQGKIWSTDAPYRELVSKIKEYGERGVLGVDMETSAMYALGKFRDVDVCNLLIVSDEDWDHFNPGTSTVNFREPRERAKRALINAIPSIQL
jgi:uridine phosphorylase